MKSVLMSIHPKWCALIASGKKTVEVRKTKPKLQTPFKVYIYCTKGKPTFTQSAFCDEVSNGKVIGEFVCDRIDEYESEFVSDDVCLETIGLVDRSAYWDCDTATKELFWDNETDDYLEQYNSTDFARQTCISYEDLKKYAGIGFNTFYGWHISDLVIYDEPRKLSKFHRPCADIKNCLNRAFRESGSSLDKCFDCGCKITRPPQSWCYVEEVE